MVICYKQTIFVTRVVPENDLKFEAAVDVNNCFQQINLIIGNTQHDLHGRFLLSAFLIVGYIPQMR